MYSYDQRIKDQEAVMGKEEDQIIAEQMDKIIKLERRCDTLVKLLEDLCREHVQYADRLNIVYMSPTYIKAMNILGYNNT